MFFVFISLFIVQLLLSTLRCEACASCCASPLLPILPPDHSTKCIFQNEKKVEEAAETAVRQNVARCLECGKTHCVHCCKPLPTPVKPVTDETPVTVPPVDVPPVDEPPVDDSVIYSRVFGRCDTGKTAAIPESDDDVVPTRRRKK